MRRNLVSVVACVLTVAGVSGCGGGPSDRDIQAAVSRYYSASHDFDFLTRDPVGIQARLSKQDHRGSGEEARRTVYAEHDAVDAQTDGSHIRWLPSSCPRQGNDPTKRPETGGTGAAGWSGFAAEIIGTWRRFGRIF